MKIQKSCYSSKRSRSGISSYPFLCMGHRSSTMCLLSIYLKPQLCTYICSRCCRARFEKERSNQKKVLALFFLGLDSDWEITKRALFNCALVCAKVRRCAPECARCAPRFVETKSTKFIKIYLFKLICSFLFGFQVFARFVKERSGCQKDIRKRG